MLFEAATNEGLNREFNSRKFSHSLYCGLSLIFIIDLIESFLDLAICNRCLMHYHLVRVVLNEVNRTNEIVASYVHYTFGLN